MSGLRLHCVVKGAAIATDAVEIPAEGDGGPGRLAVLIVAWIKYERPCGQIPDTQQSRSYKLLQRKSLAIQIDEGG